MKSSALKRNASPCTPENSSTYSCDQICNAKVIGNRRTLQSPKSSVSVLDTTTHVIANHSALDCDDHDDAISLEQNDLRPWRTPAPFSDDPIARAINEACDYSIRIPLESAKSGRAPRTVRVYADGAYDMFHSGHARQLMQAKNAFPSTYLIVGVANDADIHRLKGRTVMNETERYEAVRHCRYVDEVITDIPWTTTPEFIAKHKIDFVAHDDLPYASPDSEDIYKSLKDKGMFVATQRTEGISTTDVIGRIVRDYDLYLRRNLRRGLSRQDLNISYMTEKKIRLQDNLETMVRRGTKFIRNFDTKRRKLVYHLEDMSHEMIRSFMRIFGADGPVMNWFNNRKSTTERGSSPLDYLGLSPSSSDAEYTPVNDHGDGPVAQNRVTLGKRKRYSMTNTKCDNGRQTMTSPRPATRKYIRTRRT